MRDNLRIEHLIRRVKTPLLLMLVTSLLYFPVLFGLQDLWDGTILSYAYEINQAKVYQTWFLETGWPLVTLLHTLIHYVSLLFDFNMKGVINVIICLSLFLSSLEIFKICNKNLKYGFVSSFSASMIFLLAPVFGLYSSSVFTMHALFIYLALLGVRLYWDADSIKWKVGSLFVAMLSMQHAANATFVLLMISYCCYVEKRGGKEWLISAAACVVFFFLLREIFPSNGLYSNYNKLSISSLTSINNYLRFFDWIDKYYLYVYFLFPLLIFVNNKKKALEGVFIIGLVLAAIIPYVAVGKYPAGLGYLSRMAINIGLTVPFLVGYLISGVERKFKYGWGLALFAIVPICFFMVKTLYVSHSVQVKQQIVQSYFIEAVKELDLNNPGDVKFNNFWRPMPSSYALNYYLYLAKGSAKWSSKPVGSNLTSNKEYRDKYVLTDYFPECKYEIEVNSNIATLSAYQSLLFSINESIFKKYYHEIYLTAQIMSKKC